MDSSALTRNFASTGVEGTQRPSLGGHNGPGPAWCYGVRGTRGGAEDGEEGPGPWRRHPV